MARGAWGKVRRRGGRRDTGGAGAAAGDAVVTPVTEAADEAARGYFGPLVEAEAPAAVGAGVRHESEAARGKGPNPATIIDSTQTAEIIQGPGITKNHTHKHKIKTQLSGNVRFDHNNKMCTKKM